MTQFVVRPTMTNPATYAAYRRMTPGERLALSLAAIRESGPYLLMRNAETVKRRFERLRDENDARNRNLLHSLAAADNHHEGR
jgi:hypothetical protein